jgi:two-component system sensor histidine kinase UhpB
MLHRKPPPAVKSAVGTGLARTSVIASARPVAHRVATPSSERPRLQPWAAEAEEHLVRKQWTLLSQVIAINALLVTGTVFAATVVANLELSVPAERRQFLVIFAAILTTLLANALLLRRRFTPLDRLINAMENADLTRSGVRAQPSPDETADVARLRNAFNHMLDRLEAERRQAAQAVVRGQEQERQRLAQDLHDEVNQALTGILLRLEASMHEAPADLQRELEETKRLAQQAMEELLRLARELRPSALDDLGLLPALRTQVQDFGERTGIDATFQREGPVPNLTDEQQLAIYRVTQESLSNIAQHAGAKRVLVELSSVGRVTLRVRDDGRGLPGGADGRNFPRRDGGLGLSGMEERALLAGGRLELHSQEGRGTTVTLTLT